MQALLPMVILELLEQDLGTSRGIGLTLMSDQYKGLMETVKDIMPNAEHRQCARHSYENFRKQYPRFWHVIPAGGNLFKVKLGSEGFTVDEGKRTCNCRMWLLSGIPFVHATKLIFLINRVPESYVLAWFETDMYFVAYHNFMKPIPGLNFLPDQSMYSTVLPLKPRKIAGRPRKKRIRAIGEGGSSTKVSKVGSQGSFSNCRKHGYNKASCKEPVVEQTLKPKGVQGMKVLVGLKEVPVGLEVDEVLVGQEVVLVGLEVMLVGLEVVLVFLEKLLVGLEEVLVGLVVLVGQEVGVMGGLVVLVGQEVAVGFIQGEFHSYGVKTSINWYTRKCSVDTS
ncbi:hypothetical protein Tco_0812628 [Tanacetum coccineum]